MWVLVGCHCSWPTNSPASDVSRPFFSVLWWRQQTSIADSNYNSRCDDAHSGSWHSFLIMRGWEVDFSCRKTRRYAHSEEVLMLWVILLPWSAHGAMQEFHNSQSQHWEGGGCHGDGTVTVADGFAFEQREGRKIRKMRANTTECLGGKWRMTSLVHELLTSVYFRLSPSGFKESGHDKPNKEDQKLDNLFEEISKQNS